MAPIHQAATPPDEAALLMRCRQGEREAFDTLARQYDGPVHRFFRGRGLTPDDAEDLAQETMINAYRGIRAFQGHASFATWLFVVARRVHTDWLRRRGRREEATDPDLLDPPAAPEDTDLRLVVRAAVAALPDSYRQALLLSHVQGCSLRELAARLGVPQTTAVNWLGRARRRLREILVTEGAWQE